MKTHKLKTVQPHFDAVWSGQKTAEIRNNDRDFQVGDALYLYEYDPATDRYSGRWICTAVSHVLADSAYLVSGYVMLSFGSTVRFGDDRGDEALRPNDPPARDVFGQVIPDEDDDYDPRG